MTNADLAEALCISEVSVKRMTLGTQVITPAMMHAVVTLLFFGRRPRLKPAYEALLAEFE